jgi:hypothetical protein
MSDRLSEIIAGRVANSMIPVAGALDRYKDVRFADLATSCLFRPGPVQGTSHVSSP